MVFDDLRWVQDRLEVKVLRKNVYFLAWSFGFGRFGRPVPSGLVGPGPSGLTEPYCCHRLAHFPARFRLQMHMQI